MSAKVPYSRTASRFIRVLALIAIVLGGARPAEAVAQAQDTTLTARYHLAETYLRAGQFDRAITLLEDLYALQPSAFVFYDRLLEAYESVKRYDEAVALVDKRMAQEPGSPVLMAQKARLLYVKGDEQAAFDLWDAALAAQPDNPNTYRLVYQSLYEVRELEKAIDVLERGQQALGKDAGFQADLGYLYGQAGRHEEAFEAYLSLLAENQRQLSFVRSRLSRFMEDSVAVQAGIDAAERAVRREPLNRSFRELLGWLYLEAGDYQKALDSNRAIDRLEQESGRVLFLFAQNAADAGAYDAASQAYAEISERYPDSPAAAEARLGMAVMHEKWAQKTNERVFDDGGGRLDAPHYEQALEGYRAFLQAYPNHPYYPEALRRLGRLQQDVFRDLDAAESTYQEIIRRYRTTDAASMAELELGRIALLRNQLDQARLAFSRIVDRLGTGELVDQARYELALVHFYRGEFETAQTLAEVLNENTSALVANDAIELKVLLVENRGPDSISTPLQAYARAHLLERRHRSAEAVAVLDSLLLHHASHPLADDSRFLRARALRRSGRADEAVAAFSEIPLMHPTSFLADRSLFLAAETLEEDLDDKAAAAQTYTRLLTQYPGSLYAADARDRIRALRGDGI